jgi:hypothetical protein
MHFGEKSSKLQILFFIFFQENYSEKEFLYYHFSLMSLKIENIYLSKMIYETVQLRHLILRKSVNKI